MEMDRPYTEDTSNPYNQASTSVEPTGSQTTGKTSGNVEKVCGEGHEAAGLWMERA